MEEFDSEAIENDFQEVCREVIQNEELEQITCIQTENPTEYVIKYKAFKDVLDTLKKSFQTDKKKFHRMYTKRLRFGGQSYKSLKDIYIMLKDELIPVYSVREFPVTSEEEWNRKRIEDRLSIQMIKEQDKRKREEIHMKVQSSIPVEVDLTSVETKPGSSLNLVIIGKTGVGKSATGNLIIGQKNFFSENLQANSTTEAVTMGKAEFEGRTVYVLDTPGLFDTKRPKDEIKFEIAKCFSFKEFLEGIHAFIVVLNSQAQRFTEEEQNIVKEAKKMMGPEAFQHCIVILTHYDEYKLETRPYAKTYVENTKNKNFKKFLEEDLAGRFMFIDNHSETDYERDMYRSNIIAMVENMPKIKQNHLYTNEMFKQAHDLWKKFQEIESSITKSVIENKLVKFYNVVFEVRNFIRELSSTSMDKSCDDHLKNHIYELVSNTKRIDIKTFDMVPGALMTLCVVTLEEEYKKHSRENSDENEAMVKMRNHVDVILKSERWTLAKKEIDVDKVTVNVLELVQKKDRQMFITDEMVKEQVRNIIESEFMEKFHKDIEKVVKEVNRKIFDFAKEAIIEHPLNESDIQKLQTKDNDLYEELSNKVLMKLNSSLSDDIKKLFDEKELYDMTNRKLLERFGELESIAKKKFVNKASSACFPADTYVYKNGGQKCLISELQIGDKVLTVNSSGEIVYEDIILLSHAEHEDMSVNMVLIVDSRETICLSPKHLLHVEHFGNLLPAYKVRKGDNLFIYNGDSIKMRKVIGISKRVEIGMFCPHTASGSIIVNDVIASCYTEHFNHKIAHIILSSVNMLYKTLPFVIYQYLYGRDRLLNTPSLLKKAAILFHFSLNR